MTGMSLASAFMKYSTSKTSEKLLHPKHEKRAFKGKQAEIQDTEPLH